MNKFAHQLSTLNPGIYYLKAEWENDRSQNKCGEQGITVGWDYYITIQNFFKRKCTIQIYIKSKDLNARNLHTLYILCSPIISPRLQTYRYTDKDI